MGKDGKVWMGQTDRVGIGDLRVGLLMGVGRCGPILTKVGKDGQVWMGQTD